MLPPKFKEEALKLLTSGELTVVQLERDLGISVSSLKQGWREAVHEAKTDLSEEVPKTTKAARINQLAQKNTRQRQELGIQNSDGHLQRPKGLRFKFIEEHRD